MTNIKHPTNTLLKIGNTTYNLNDLINNTAIGTNTNSISKNIYGFNQPRQMNRPPVSRTGITYRFFTRPMLHLTNESIARNPNLVNLLNNNSSSINKCVKCLLDPRAMNPPTKNYGGMARKPVFCNEVNNKLGFIPILSNNLRTINGFPDIVYNSYEGAVGNKGQSLKLMEGDSNVFNSYELTTTFTNTKDNLIPYLFKVWTTAAAGSRDGSCDKNIDFIVSNEIEYQTAIYSIVTAEDNETIEFIAKTGTAYPFTLPFGHLHETDESEIHKINDAITINFKCDGILYDNPIIKRQFNMVGEMFNSSLKDKNRDKAMVLMGRNEYNRTAQGFPRINLTENKLEWWVYK